MDFTKAWDSSHITTALVTMVTHYDSTGCHGNILRQYWLPWYRITSALVAMVTYYNNTGCHGNVLLQHWLPWKHITSAT